jgi:hypothetical protein
MKVFSVFETIVRLTCPPFSLSGHLVEVACMVVVVAWRLLPSNDPRGALNMHMDRSIHCYTGRWHGVEGRRGCPGVQQRLLRSGRLICFIKKKGAKRPPARISGLLQPLTMTVLCTSYHAGVRNVTPVSQTFILRERKIYLKKWEFGGGGGVKQDNFLKLNYFIPPVP